MGGRRDEHGDHEGHPCILPLQTRNKSFVLASLRRGVTVWYTSRCFVDCLAFSHKPKCLELRQVSKRISGGGCTRRVKLRSLPGCSHFRVAVKDSSNA